MGPSCIELVYLAFWHIEIGATSKIDDVLIEQGGLPFVLPFAVHLELFCGTSRWDYSKMFLPFEFFLWDPSSMLKN